MWFRNINATQLRMYKWCTEFVVLSTVLHSNPLRLNEKEKSKRLKPVKEREVSWPKACSTNLQKLKLQSYYTKIQKGSPLTLITGVSFHESILRVYNPVLALISFFKYLLQVSSLITHSFFHTGMFLYTALKGTVKKFPIWHLTQINHSKC